MFYSTGPCGLYYKHVAIINYSSSSVNKFRVSLNDDARVIIYNRHMFIVQAPGVNVMKLIFHVICSMAKLARVPPMANFIKYHS
jgi:hypothetical protein